MMPHFLAQALWINPTAVALAMSIAGAILSVFVVLRRWAFVGEGIGHSGVGGAGTVWLLALWFPFFDRPWVPYAAVVVACLLTALFIGILMRSGGVSADTAIGIFLVASMAWGFLGQQVYSQAHHGTAPVGWDTLIFGQMRDFSGQYALAAVAVCLAVVLVVIALNKEILAYCIDPTLAEVSGVPSGLVHYLLMLLLAMTIVIGTRIAGGVLVTALLVLPGAAALQLSQRLGRVMTISIFTGAIGALTGVIVNHRWPFIPTGPIIVLTLVTEFVIAFTIPRFGR